MELLAVALVAVAVFGLCFCVDRVFTGIFRGRPQHKTGLSVRLSKRYGSFGTVLAVLGLAAIFTGIRKTALLIAGGIFLILLGTAMIVYYMTFGIFYDEESFLLTTFGKKSKVYAYREIQAQQLFTASGNIVIELYMTDGSTVQLQAGMTGVYPFLDYAFSQWLRQTGRVQQECDFYDPQNSCWFPPVEG